jgi:type IV pilus assembly protein PilP
MKFYWAFLSNCAISVSMCLIILFSLTSCMNNSMSDLEQYVQREQNKAPKDIPPLPAIKSYPVYTYNEAGLRNPFVDENTSIARFKEECPQITRAKDALETEPLDTLTLVGSLEQEGERWALIKDQKRNVHRLKKGEHMGQNNGRIIVITESEVVLQELVSDHIDGCKKRKTTLAIASR